MQPSAQQSAPQLTPEEIQRLVAQKRAEKNYPGLEKTKDERYLDYILNPKSPDNPHISKFYAFASDAAVHLQLANIPDPTIYYRFRRGVVDLFRTAAWDADEYFEQRQLKFETELLMTKSIGWTKNTRERDALNENRSNMIIRDDRPQQPRESPGFIQGFFRG